MRMFSRTVVAALLVPATFFAAAACGGEQDASAPGGSPGAAPGAAAPSAGAPGAAGERGAQAPSPDSRGAGAAGGMPTRSGGSPGTTPGADTPAADTAATTGGAGQPFEGTTAPTMRRATITGLSTQTAVRAGRQQGFDRVVFEFGSGGLPGYTIEYVGRPIRQCGSGNAVSVAGSAWLRVGMTPARAHDDDGQATVAERALSPGLPAVRALRLTCDFEAVLEWVIGVDERKPYRVLELRNPDRLVVDILH